MQLVDNYGCQQNTGSWSGSIVFLKNAVLGYYFTPCITPYIIYNFSGYYFTPYIFL